jgi:signal transduction histidine kinase
VTDSTRDAVTHLRPRVLDDLGLGAAAAWLVSSVQKHSGLDCALHVEGEDPGAVDTGLTRTADDVSLAAFRVLQEALTNVVRHADATRVEVTLRFAGGVSLRVDDDGAGIPEAPSRTGMGLIGMRERARALGGSVVVEPRPGGGTRVRCELPARGAG